MTGKKALITLSKTCMAYQLEFGRMYIDKKDNEALQTLKEIVQQHERRLPKKVKVEDYVEDYLAGIKIPYGHCPGCQECIVYDDENYCKKCGQKLEWGDENDR